MWTRKDLAKFTVSVDASNLAEDSYAYRGAAETGFLCSTKRRTRWFTWAKGRKPGVLSCPACRLRRSERQNHGADVHGEAGAGGAELFKAEDVQQFKLDENASQTLTFENEPKAALNVSLNYRKEYELSAATRVSADGRDDDALRSEGRRARLNGLSRST